MADDSRFSARWRSAALIVLIMAATAITLWTMGRLPICSCGTVKLWFGLANHDETSQHLIDWYSFSHINHGIIFYGLLWLAFGRWPVRHRLTLAVAIEAA